MDRIAQYLFLHNSEGENNFREIEKGITIYSDIDEVIHDFRKPFYKELKKRYNIDMDDTTVPGEHDLRKPITSKYGVPEKEFDDLIEHINGLREWVPTKFSKYIINFIKTRKRKGDTILFVTARASIRGAKYIIKEALGEYFPIIQCDSSDKKYIIKDNSIFFEDRGDTIECCAKMNPNSLIIAPEWPWNSYLKEKSINNVRVCQKDCFETILKGIDIFLDCIKKLEYS